MKRKRISTYPIKHHISSLIIDYNLTIKRMFIEYKLLFMFYVYISKESKNTVQVNL